MNARVKPPVDVITFGCRLNAYESEAIRAQAAADGVTNAVVFNTCAVTGEAVRQARQAIRKARRERPGLPHPVEIGEVAVHAVPVRGLLDQTEQHEGQ